MDISLFYSLRNIYLSSPEDFERVLKGNDSESSFYRLMAQEFFTSFLLDYQSSSATVVQLFMDGGIVFSNSNAVFARTKDEIKNNLGSVSKIGPNNVLVADPNQKKAIILSVNLSSFMDSIKERIFGQVATPEDDKFLQAIFGDYNSAVGIADIVWEYNSKLQVGGFYLFSPEAKVITVRDDCNENFLSRIRQGMTITWTNNSNKPVSIYSGTTTYDQFALNPDLGIYGGDFKSPVLQSGESWSKKFFTVANYDWFVYPDILTGTISVTGENVNAEDTFLVLERDGFNQPFSSRVIKIDSWGNILWSFGEAYLVKPRKVRPLINGGVIIST